jgi:hypothetical protein
MKRLLLSIGQSIMAFTALAYVLMVVCLVVLLFDWINRNYASWSLTQVIVGWTVICLVVLTGMFYRMNRE